MIALSTPSDNITLRRHLAFAQRILDSNQDCIKVLDLQGRLIYMNDSGQALMEIDRFAEQAEGASWVEFWQGSDREAAQQAFDLALDGKTGRFDGYCCTAKGTPKWWEVVVTPIYDEEGQLSEVLSASRDITARKQAEEMLKVRNQELDQFAYVVSHDLKAPLRGIASLSSWIQEDLGRDISEETQQQLTLIHQRVQRMSALVDGLLQFSRSGRQLEAEPVEVEGLLLEVVDSLSPAAGFSVVWPASLPRFLTKRLLLSQVLSNLIGNALKHHDRDRGQIQISVEEKGEFYQFAIADDGPGIPASAQERVFEIFHTQDSNPTTTNTGIGLALVKKIVQAEGGNVWLEVSALRGCKFCFTWRKEPKPEKMPS